MKKNPKVKTLPQVLKVIKKLKTDGKIIITTNGVYDLIHPGHIKSLYEAKKQGDFLIVGINSNKSVKRNKSAIRPIMDEKSRAEVVASMEPVDIVFIFNESTPVDFLSKLKPHIHTNGSEYGKDCVEKEIVEKNGGKIYLLKKYPRFSTSKIIKKIISLHDQKKS